MSLISPEGLQGAYDVCINIINTLEHNYNYVMNCMGEPQLGKRGLYSTISMKGSSDNARIIRDFTAYADGNNDLINISNLIGVPTANIIPVVQKLLDAKLIRIEKPL